MAGAAHERLEPKESAPQASHSGNSWPPGPKAPRADIAVDVWRIGLVLPEAELSRLSALLSVDELERSQRFYFQEHRQKFVAAHGSLREILGRYLGIPADSLRFDYSPYGKPSLNSDFSGSDLSFNLSHSHELALVAVGSRRALGIDIEYMRPDLADEQVARRFFSSLEVEEYLSLPDHLRKQAFFSCWTRKEAYIKARGEGLSMPLDQFDVTLHPEKPAELIRTRPDPAQALQWKLYALTPDLGYCAALAVKGEVEAVHCWHWNESAG